MLIISCHHKSCVPANAFAALSKVQEDNHCPKCARASAQICLHESVCVTWNPMCHPLGHEDVTCVTCVCSVGDTHVSQRVCASLSDMSSWNMTGTGAVYKYKPMLKSCSHTASIVHKCMASIGSQMAHTCSHLDEDSINHNHNDRAWFGVSLQNHACTHTSWSSRS